MTQASNIQPTVISNPVDGYYMGGARVYDSGMYIWTKWSNIQRLDRANALQDARNTVADLRSEGGA